ncbi:putative DNA-binding domain-containing protein [Chelatococcus sambhunathii]|uniref:DNA-binding domain-containing protein n=1 Tax=Chelatococcus sambhunathii TaxID=363953 RepID=A0ABU1DG16_9HYPH|nr:DNA-binding domain-containing protein [Chelatococcus sambhunathii]MDR4307042.1 putative DNA-binding domain-containing protein [Chelatococcus sambhunathii]
MSAATQTALAAALRDTGRGSPAQASSSGQRPDRRFSVYRNNVAVSLIGALETRFPAVRRIVGDDFFGELARAYVSQHAPRSPLMMTYGDDFPDFAARAPGLADVPYLADVARLEAARTRAYHAADADPLPASAFAAPDGALDDVRLTLHPSVEVVRSAHPLVTIWAMNSGEAELGSIDDWSPEDALVCRPAMDVFVRKLPEGGAAFLQALAGGATLAAAAERAAQDAPSFDLTENLVGLIGGGLVVAIETPSQQGDAP